MRAVRIERQYEAAYAPALNVLQAPSATEMAAAPSGGYLLGLKSRRWGVQEVSWLQHPSTNTRGPR